MDRFNRTDNAIAAQHFARATELDPYFAGAHAAMSFANFQVAFLNYKADPSVEIANGQRFAEKCLELDRVDPFGNFTYGRSQWIRGEPEAGQAWIERSINISPSFAQAIYAHGRADLAAASRCVDCAILRGVSPSGHGRTPRAARGADQAWVSRE